MAAAVARHAGARHVVITDVNPDRLALAGRSPMCARSTSQEDLKDVIRDWHEAGLRCRARDVRQSGRARPDGRTPGHGRAHRAARHPAGQKPGRLVRIVFKAITIKGVYGREIFETWYKMIAMLENGLDVRRVITHRFPPTTTAPGFERCCRASRARSCWTGPEAAKCPSTPPPAPLGLRDHTGDPMSRFGPTRGELKLRLAISLRPRLLIGAYALNGIGGIASLEIAIIGGAFFGGSAIWSARRLLQSKDPTHERRYHLPTVLLALVFLAWAWLLIRTITLLQSRGGIGTAFGPGSAAPKTGRDRNTLLFLTFVLAAMLTMQFALPAG
jgi:hypothetical protein